MIFGGKENSVPGRRSFIADFQAFAAKVRARLPEAETAST